MKYLVIGASGYVGQEILRQLSERDADITVLNKNRASNIGTSILADITNAVDLKEKIGNQSFDFIIHVASLPGDTGDPAQMMDINVKGLFNMLELARGMEGLKRYVVTSSTSAYEWYPATKFCAPDYMPVDENHPCRPKDMYCATKRMQEILAVTYYHEYKVPTACLRLTAVVGPNGQGGGSGWRTIAEELEGGKIVHIPHFTLEERCHYVDIRDVARMHLWCIDHDEANGQIFNCVGPMSTTGQELADAIHKFYPEIQVETGFPWSQAQGGQIEFSMAKAKDIMGYEPLYTITDSIENLKNWIDAGGLSVGTGRTDSFVKDGLQQED